MRSLCPSGRGPARVRLLTLFLTFAACATPGPLPPEQHAPREATAKASLPPWVGQPLSWEKLEHIERWLETQADASSAYWAVEAELALSEGRLAFARQDANSARSERAALDTRVASAREGFERVLADARASQDQLLRARGGLESAADFGYAPAAREAAAFAGVLSRARWGALRANPARMERATGRWRYITVHHSAEAHPPELSGSLEDSAAAIRSIQHAHMQSEGYGDLGYHFVIDPFGRIFEGRDLEWQGAHAGGSNNYQNIGVCLLGNFNNTRPSTAALGALEHLLKELRSTWSISKGAVRAHCDWKTTDCPGTNLKQWLRSNS